VSRSAEEVLEFTRLREIVRGFTTCALGRRAVEALVPRMDAAALDADFALIRETMAYLRAGSEFGFGSVADTEGWLPRLAVPAAVLGPGELLDVASLMDAVAALKAVFREEAAEYPKLAERAARLVDFRALVAEIRRAIFPNGEISDDASPQLKRLRGTMAQTRDKIQQSLQRILRARGEEAGHDYITLRNERFVIPVRASDRRAVPGVVHGASATGQTVFVEPLETIDLNNRLVQLAEDEAVEIARILAELTERLRLERGPLDFAAENIAAFDSIFARARYAREFDCAIPTFAAGNRLRLTSARNPVLERSLREKGRAVVPMTITLGGSETIMVISGPNTGGKTVALKTAGLAALSAQSGIPVAAEEAELPLFDRVLADIGDEQSITADLSTFSAHVVNLKHMLEVATSSTLVLVDEMGTGTAPEEGAALAVALLDEFRARGSLTIATTHHDRLKSYASTTPGIVNAAVEFNEAELRPTYRLLVGVPGVSSGIEIARRLGLPAQVIERARGGLTAETHEARGLIAYLHRSRDEMEELKRQSQQELERLEAERRTLQTEWVERQRKRVAELEKRFGETVKQLEADVARLTADIVDRKARAQAEKAVGRRLIKVEADARAETDAAVLDLLAGSQQDLGVGAEARPRPIAADELMEGARIHVRGMKQPVVFLRRDGHAAEVQAGPLRMKVPLADIVSMADAPTSAAPPVGGTAVSRATPAQMAAAQQKRGVTVHTETVDDGAATTEINVIGCTVEEATRLVDKFIDSATLANLARVRIIHGHGTGALRRGLAEFLSTHPLVAKSYAEAADRGGAAITLVDLRD
jgi:DNA mismatch repair protein MutS2